MERVSIPIRSAKLFALSTLYDANKELLGKNVAPAGSRLHDTACDRAAKYWSTLAEIMPDWKKVAAGLVPAAEIRQEKISTHATVLRALGGVGRIVMERHPERWANQLQLLSTVDWRKSVAGRVNPQWDGVCISAGSVVANRQARLATLEALCRAVKLPEEDVPGHRKRGRPRKVEQ